MVHMEQIKSTVIRIAAEEAYQNEVIDTLMEESIIGEGKEYRRKGDWLQSKVDSWFTEAVDEYEGNR